MIDIHCHLLPGIDDGAQDMQQSLALAAHAVAHGITHMVLTPHIQPGMYDNHQQSIRQVFDAFHQAVEAAKLDLQIAMAAEVRICPEILPMIAADEIPLFLSEQGKKTILLEFPHSHILPGSDNMVAWLRKRGIDCLIAHPERNKSVMSNIDQLLPFLNMGCKLQLTAASVAGSFGEQSRQVAIKLLQRGWVSLLASDAHSLRRRPPELEAGRKAAEAVIGFEAANDLVVAGPQAIVGGMFASA